MTLCQSIVWICAETNPDLESIIGRNLTGYLDKKLEDCVIGFVHQNTRFSVL